MAAPVAADEAWTAIAVKNGVTDERRAVAGSSFFEYRASTVMAASQQAVLSAIWTSITDSPPETVKKRVVLGRTETQMLVYDQIETPMVTDRDVTIGIRKIVHEDTKVIEVKFDAMNSLGPPSDGKHVRIPIVRGAWTLVPSTGGGTQLTYVCYSDPGGSIPAILARGVQQRQIPLDFERVVQRVQPH